MHQIPFLRIAVSFALGILVYELLQPEVNFIIILALLSCTLVLFSFLPAFKDRVIRYNQWIGISIMCGFFSLGNLYVHYSSVQKPDWSLDNEMVMKVKLLESPQKREKSYRAEVEMVAYIQNGKYTLKPGKILLYFSKEIPCYDWKANDELMIASKLHMIDGPKNPGEFDLASYNRRKGIYHRSFIQPKQLLSYKEAAGWSLQKVMHSTKKHLLNLSAKHFNSPTEKALADALVLGYHDDLDEETISHFAKSGTSHVLVVSGLHLGIVWLVLDKILLAFLNRYTWTRWLKLFLALGMLWGYAVLTGLSPSVMRAAVMFSCFSVGAIMRQKHISLNILFVSAFIQMLINPMVIFNIGFQLSYSAVASILIFFNPIKNALYFRKKSSQWLWEMAALTISAQIITTPVSLYWFGQFPVWFIFSNVILVPISSATLMVGLAAYTVGWLPYLGDLLFHIFILLIKIMGSLAAFFSELPYSSLPAKFNVLDVILFYVLIIFMSLFLINRKAIWFKFSLGVISCFLIAGLMREMMLDNNEKWIVYSTKSGTVIRQLIGHNAYEYRSNLADRKSYAFSVKPSDKTFDITYLTNVVDKNGFLQLGNKKIVMLKKEHLVAEILMPVRCNWIVVESLKYIDFNKLEHNFKFDKLIFGSGNSRKSKTFWKKECIKRNIAFYDVAEEGALIVN